VEEKKQLKSSFKNKLRDSLKFDGVENIMTANPIRRDVSYEKDHSYLDVKEPV
jgi:hypothetical protein